MSVPERAAAALQVSQVSKSFGALSAVSEVSLQVNKGEIVGVIGPNGSGKSTLFNLISGVYPPDSGQIHLNGQPVAGLPAFRVARAGLCRTFQIASPFAKMSVRDNLRTAASVGFWQRHGERAEQVLALLRLSSLREELAENLSGGQQKLLELGRVLMRDPSVILLDEIGAGVTPALKTQLSEAILKQREAGRTFVIVEHDMEFVRSLCDRIMVMALGKVLVEGDFDTVVAHPEVIESYLGMEA